MKIETETTTTTNTNTTIEAEERSFILKILDILRNDQYIFYLIFSTLLIWCISYLYLPHYIIPKKLLGQDSSGFKIFAAQIVTIKVLLVTFFLLYRGISQRVVIMLLATGAIILIGQFIGFYNASYAFQKINVSSVSLLFGMSLISIIIAETKCFEIIALKLMQKFGNSHFALFIVLCISTYIFSLFMNSFIAIFLVVPITLNLTNNLKLNSVPFIIGEIIATNLGGTSTMMGDFPNIIIATRLHIPLDMFIKYLMPICLVNLSVMFIYFYKRVDFNINSKESGVLLSEVYPPEVYSPSFKIEHHLALIFSIVVVLALASTDIFFTSLDPGLSTLVAGFILFCICGIDKKQIIKKIRYDDTLFYILIFAFLGGIEASGLLTTISNIISQISFDNNIIKCLLLMWSASFITMIFGAGPTAALFLPLFMSLNIDNITNNSIKVLSIEHSAIWALSLGVCAGSIGILDVTLLGPGSTARRKQNNIINYFNYSKIGLPMMYFQLLVSTIYILVLFIIQ
ncbi:MAG: hypothetical protein HQK49_04795 [Oligoflexia bacterium]|nr:hypothetical protein [Oligoflexia bacterium]